MFDSLEIEKMSTAELLQAMESIWEALKRRSAGRVSPEWHEKVLARRKLRAKKGEAKFLTLMQLRSRLAQR